MIYHESFVSCWEDTQISCILKRIILKHRLICVNLILVNVLNQIKFSLLGVHWKQVLILLVYTSNHITLKFSLVWICFLIDLVLLVVERFVFLFISSSLLNDILLFKNLILLANNLLLLNECLVYILRTIYLGFEFFLNLLILLRSTLWIYIKCLQLHFIFQALLLTNNQISLL